MKRIYINENDLSTLDTFKIGFDNDTYGHVVDEEISASDVDVSSFNVQESLCPEIWENYTLKSDVRMKLLNIADDFIDYLDINWVKPSDIILTGSICIFLLIFNEYFSFNCQAVSLVSPLQETHEYEYLSL